MVDSHDIVANVLANNWCSHGSNSWPPREMPSSFVVWVSNFMKPTYQQWLAKRKLFLYLHVVVYQSSILKNVFKINTDIKNLEFPLVKMNLIILVIWWYHAFQDDCLLLPAPSPFIPYAESETGQTLSDSYQP